MDKNRLHKECMGIVNKLFDLAEVPAEKRQAINDTADKYVQEQFLRLFTVVGRSEQLPCEHEERSMQGNGFTYVICSKCGEDL